MIPDYIPSFGSLWSPLTQIGDQCAGGYYIGQIRATPISTPYAIIVSPNSEGGNAGSGLQYKTNNTDSPGSTYTTSDGSVAFADLEPMAMLEYPAARYCATISVNGYDDWYLPALAEMDLLYQLSIRPDQISVPAQGLIYPVSDSIFHADGAEACLAYGYWTSTSSARYTAWRINMADGSRSQVNKTTTAYVRAMRRIDTTIDTWTIAD